MKQRVLMVAITALVLGVALGDSAPAQSGRAKVTTVTRPGTEFSLVQTGNGGYLGVYLGDVSEERAKELKLPEVRGAIVGQVLEGSPAAKAGLRADDVIVSYNNERVESAAQLHRLLIETPPGRSVTLGVRRDGALQNIQVTLGERSGPGLSLISPGTLSEIEALRSEAEKMRAQSEESRRKNDDEAARNLLELSEKLRKQSEDLRADMERLQREGKVFGFDNGRRLLSIPGPARYHLGVSVTPLSDQLAKFFNVKDTGLLVTEVEAQSAADRAGLKAGDCITAVNGERVSSAAELSRLISRPGKDDKEGDEVSLTVVRDRNVQTIKVKPERRELRLPDNLRSGRTI